MTMEDYKQRKVFEYQWSKMTDKEKDDWIKVRESTLVDMRKAVQLQMIIENDLLTDDQIVELLATNNYGPQTKGVLLKAGCQKGLIGSEEVLCYFGLLEETK